MNSSLLQLPPLHFSLPLSCETLLPSLPGMLHLSLHQKYPGMPATLAICHLQGLTDIFNQKVIGSLLLTVFTPLANTLPILKAYLEVWFVGIIVVGVVHTGFGERQQKRELCFHLKAFCLCTVGGLDAALWLPRQKYIKGHMWWSPIIGVSGLKVNM